MGGCQIPLPRSWRSRSTAARRRSGSARGTRHPARPVKPSSIPLMRFTTLIGTARTDLSAADGRAPGHRQERGRSLADTYNLGGWFTTAGGRRPSEGPVPDVRPEGSGQRPRRSGSLEAIRAATAAWLGVTYRCKVVSRGRAAPPRHRVPVPVRGAPPGVRAVRRRDRAARPGSGAAGLACRAPDAQIRADLGGQRRVRRAAEDRDLTQLRIPGFPAGTAAGPGTP
jgi:hypothetical protein